MTSFASSFNLSRFKYICQLAEHLGAIVRTIYNTGAFSNKGEAAKQCVTDLHTKLCAWYNSLPHHMRISPQACPTVLVAHIFYHTALILLFRPFIQSWKSRQTPADSSPLAICTQSALAISRYIEQYRRTYSLRRCVNWLVHAVFTAATIYVINGAASSSPVDPLNGRSEAMAVNKEAVRKLRELMGALEEMSRAWRNAENCLSQIRQWIHKYQLVIAPHPGRTSVSAASGVVTNSVLPGGLDQGAAWLKTPVLSNSAIPSHQQHQPLPVADFGHPTAAAAAQAMIDVTPTHPTTTSPPGALMADMSMFELDYGIWNDMIQDFMTTDTTAGPSDDIHIQ
jgi:hypothetical protein